VSAAVSGKKSFGFMVFREAFNLPDGRNRITLMNDPNTPTDVRDKIRQDFNDSVDVVKEVADRNTQRGRHAANHATRERVMAGLQIDRGKPKRGEPSRLAALHGVPVNKVRKWVEQLRTAPRSGSAAIRLTWLTVYQGESLRHRNRLAGRQRKKPKV
jgi:hypothetical protein